MADPSVSIIGLISGPGEGKSRLLLDGLDQIQRSQPATRIVIACSQSLDTADLAQMGRSETLMVVDDAQELPQFYGQVSRRHKRYFITFCLTFLKGNWSGITDGGMEAFPIVISFYPHPEIM